MRAISTVQATPTRKLFNPFRAHGALLQGLAVPASPTRKLFSPFRAHGALLQGLAVPAPPRPHHPTVTRKTRHAGDWAIA